MGKKKQKTKIDQKQFWGKGFLWLLLLLPDYSPSWREATAELKAETEAAVTGELQLAACFPWLARAATFLTQPRPTYPKTGQPTVVWTLPHQSAIKIKSLTDMLTG